MLLADCRLPGLKPLDQPLKLATHTPPPPPSSAGGRSYFPARDGANRTLPSNSHSRAQLPPPGNRSSRKVQVGPSSRMRRGHIRSTLSLSNRFESSLPPPGAGHRKPHGGSQGEVSEANPRRVPGSIGTPPLSVANGQAALRQQVVGAAGGKEERRKQATNQVAPTPPPPPTPDLVYGSGLRLQCGC